MRCVCDICYRYFDTQGFKPGLYCSRACYEEAKRREYRLIRKEILAEDGSILIDQGRVRIGQIEKVEAEARKQGLSYGQLVGQKWLKGKEVIR